MVFCSAKHKINNITINNKIIPIEQVKHTTCLGMITYNKLYWSNHISYVYAKIPTGVYIIRRAENNSL